MDIRNASGVSANWTEGNLIKFNISVKNLGSTFLISCSFGLFHSSIIFPNDFSLIYSINFHSHIAIFIYNFMCMLFSVLSHVANIAFLKQIWQIDYFKNLISTIKSDIWTYKSHDQHWKLNFTVLRENLWAYNIFRKIDEMKKKI